MDVPPFFWGEHIHQLKLTVIYPGILKFLNPFFSLVSVVSSDALFFFLLRTFLHPRPRGSSGKDRLGRGPDQREGGSWSPVKTCVKELVQKRLILGGGFICFLFSSRNLGK